MAKKVVTPVEKESKASQGWFKRKQKPDAQKKQTLNESNKKLNHNGIPAVHGSQPAYYEGSESMYVQLQASLQQTGNLNHPDTQKKEMDYKKSLGINDLRDYHDIKSGNYISKTPAEKPYKTEVAKKNPEVLATAKEPSPKETVKTVQTTSAVQQPTNINKTEVFATAKEPSIKETVKTLQNKSAMQQPASIKNTEALATTKMLDAKEIVKTISNTSAIQKPETPVPAKALDIKPPVKTVQSKSVTQEPAKVNKPEASEDTPAKKISQLTPDKPGSVVSKNQKNASLQKKENQESIPTNSDVESKEDSKNKKEKSGINSEKELKIVVPEVIKPVVTPRLDKAVDSEQSEVAPDPETTLNIIGLATVAQEFRDQGQEAKTQLESQKEVIKTLKSKIKGVEKEIQKSDADLLTAEKSVGSKENLVNLVEKGLVTSINRQHKVEQEVGIYQQEYDKNKGKANDLNTEAASLLGESQEYQDPSEPDSGKLAKKLNELSSGANTISQAVTQAGSTTQKLSQEAKQAKEKNQKTQKDSTESKKVLLKSKAKLVSDKQKNTKAKAELATLNPKLKESEAEGKKLNKEATALLLDSYVIESDIIRTQNAYYTDMATVEGRNSLKKKEADKIEQTPSELNPGETLLVAFVQLKSEEEQTAFLRNLDKSELDLLKAKYDEVIANYDTNEAEKEASIGQNVESIRDAQIGGFNNKRKDALQKPLKLVTKNLNRITGLKRLWMSISIALSGVWNGITSVTWTDVGKFALAIVNPVEWVKAIGSSISGIWDDISNWKGFSEDPVGMILQKAAGIANKLLTISGVITGILGLLTIAVAVGSFFTLGALAPLAAWLGGATVTMGTITFWIGAVALGLNVLNGIKNIYDIHTAKTAEVLFKNSGELKSDIVNSGMSILAMVGGKASVKGGTMVKNMAKNYPKTFGKRMFISLKNGIKTSIVSIPKKIGSLFKKGTWIKAYQGFQKAYKKAITWTKEKFQKKKPVQNGPMRYGPYEEQVVPDRMNEQPLIPKKADIKEPQYPQLEGHLTKEELTSFEKALNSADSEVLSEINKISNTEDFVNLAKSFKDNPNAFIESLKSYESLFGERGWYNFWKKTPSTTQSLDDIAMLQRENKLLPTGDASDIELASVHAFTVDGGFINTPSRFNPSWFGKYNSAVYKDLQSALAKLRKVEGRNMAGREVLSGRMESLEYFNSTLKNGKGKEVAFKGMVSATLDEKVAEGFIELSARNVPKGEKVAIIREITTQEGVYIDDLSDWGKNFGKERHFDADPPSTMVQEEVLMNEGYFRQVTEPKYVKTLNGIDYYKIKYHELVKPLN